VRWKTRRIIYQGLLLTLEKNFKIGMAAQRQVSHCYARLLGVFDDSSPSSPPKQARQVDYFLLDLLFFYEASWMS